MNENRDPLDEALASLPRSVEPTRDLWSGIHAEIAGTTPARGASLRVGFAAAPRWVQLAAGVLLVIASSFTTYVLTRQSMQNETPALAQETLPAPQLPTMPASFGAEQLGAGYFEARGALDAEFEQRVAALPASTRAKVQSDLADLRRAANEIAATLAQHPSDPLLQELLMSTYESELQLFANVNEMTARTSRVEL